MQANTIDTIAELNDLLADIPGYPRGSIYGVIRGQGIDIYCLDDDGDDVLMGCGHTLESAAQMANELIARG